MEGSVGDGAAIDLLCKPTATRLIKLINKIKHVRTRSCGPRAWYDRSMQQCNAMISKSCVRSPNHLRWPAGGGVERRMRCTWAFRTHVAQLHACRVPSAEWPECSVCRPVQGFSSDHGRSARSGQEPGAGGRPEPNAPDNPTRGRGALRPGPTIFILSVSETRSGRHECKESDRGLSFFYGCFSARRHMAPLGREPCSHTDGRTAKPNIHHSKNFQVQLTGLNYVLVLHL